MCSRDKNTRLVWTDDPRDKGKVDDGEGKPSGQTAAKMTDFAEWTAVFRIEKGGRGGKTVTVIDQLPRHETFLSGLCRELKSKCGSGGTYSVTGTSGVIEIQGDKRAAIKAIFEKKGIRYKGM